VGTVLFGSFPAIYKISKWLIKKDIYMFGRAFLSKKADFFILLALMWAIAYLITDKNKWKQAYEEGSVEGGLVSAGVVTLVPFIIISISRHCGKKLARK